MQNDKQMRIGIIGAGPAGLGAAEALREQGYQHITILEKMKRHGGMTLSLTYETPDHRKIIYEMGSLQPVSSNLLYRLINKYNINIGKPVSENGHKDNAIYLKLYSLEKHQPIVDFTKHQFGFPAKDGLSLLNDMMKLGKYLFRYRHLAKPGFHVSDDILQELSVSCDEWVTNGNFSIMEIPLRMLGVTMTMGYTKNKSQVSAILLLKLLLQTVQWPPSRLRYINGLHKFVLEGYQELWNRVAKQHDVILGAHIKKIIRKEGVVEVELEDKKLEFDKLIISCSPTQAATFLEATPEEQEIIEKIRFSPGWRVAFLAKGLPHDALYSFVDPYLKENYGPFLQGFYPEGEVEKDLWLYSGGISVAENVPIEPHLESAAKFLKDEFNSEVVEWVSTMYWPEYVPHFLPEEVRKGIYQKFEDLQGKNNTYYAGGAICGHSHATVVEYSYDLVKRFFHIPN